MGCGSSNTTEGKKKSISAEGREEYENYKWDQLKSKFPNGKSEEDKAKRKAIWENDLGLMGKEIATLDVLTEGMEKYLALPKVIGAKKPVKLSYEQAITWKSDKYGSKGGLHMKQFRAFLYNLQEYIQLWHMFIKIDTSEDRKLQLDEFVKAVPLLETWGVKIKNPEQTFNDIDTNKGGTISFHEFSTFAMKESLKMVEED